MKILHVINSLATGGAEKLLLETLLFYNAEVIKADLLVLNGTDHPFLNELKALNCCKIFSLGKKSVYNPLHVFQIMPYLNQYDLVHVHLFPAQYWVVLAKFFSFSQTKLIFTEHNTNNRRLENFWFRLLDKNIYQFYSKIICITDEIKEIFKNNYHLKDEKLCVIENGINLNEINSAFPLSRDSFSNFDYDDKLLIQVSGFRLQKDQKTLIRAMAILPEYFKLILVGMGHFQSECENLVKELNLEKRVLFLGSRLDVPELLKTADFVVLSSKYEGLSLSSIEGMASGKPFIASDVPGLRELVKDFGVLFPVGDERKLAEEIMKLDSDKDHYDNIVKKCLERASQYDISKMVSEHISLYKELLK